MQLAKEASYKARQKFAAHDAKVVSHKPKLVRGLTGTDPSNPLSIARLVVKALSDDPGWCAVDADLVKVEDFTPGEKGTKTMKITAPVSQAGDPSPHPPVVVLHSRIGQYDHDDWFMRRMGAAQKLFSDHGLGPRRLAEGSDWFVEEWQGKSFEKDWVAMAKESKMLDDWKKIGQLLAKVHKMPTEWFEEFRDELIAKRPVFKEVPKGSHVWSYFARDVKLNDFGVMTDPDCADVLKEYADPGAFGPVHPVGKRIVTAHCDYHPCNIVAVNDGCLCIDFEGTVVTHAIQDLAYGVASSLLSSNKRAFLTAYLETLGESTDDLETLLLDCELAQLASWAYGGRLDIGDCRNLCQCIAGCADIGGGKEDVLELVNFCKTYASKVRASPELQRKLLGPRWLSNLFLLGPRWLPNLTYGCLPCELLWASALRSPCLENQMQDDWKQFEKYFDETKFERVLKSMATSKWYTSIQSSLEVPTKSFACQPVEDSEGFVIKSLREPSLAVQVKPGTDRLELANHSADDPNQKWRKIGHRIQHMGTGLFLHAEAKYPFYKYLGSRPWDAVGSALFVRPHGGSDSQFWFFDGDFLRQVIGGRALDVNFWILKAGNGVNLNIPHTNKYGCSWLFQGNCNDCAASEDPGLVPPTITDIPEGVEFHIKPALKQELCFSTRADGDTKEPFEIYLAEMDGSEKQKWKLVDGNQFQNVATGQFLDSEVKYVYISNLTDIWEDTETCLRTRPQDHSHAQKWVFVPEEFHGGKVLRHFKDGRAVSVCDWELEPNQRVEVENTPFFDLGIHIGEPCRGISYILSPV